jgi:lipopolysaccharide biosynthesis glycosyltransferase
MHIVSSADDNYAQHLAVMFVSLLKNMDTTRTVKLYVIHSEMKEHNKQLLYDTTFSYGVPIEFLEMNKHTFHHAYMSKHINNHVTKTAYYRICIPELITDPKVKKAIYIDCDALVLDDISKLWDTDFSPHLCAAVEDAGQHRRLENMGISDTSKYFNSGVLFIHFDQWRKQQITEKILNFTKTFPKEKLMFHDQDALNAILHDKWHKLHPRWNAQTHIIMKEKTPETLAEKNLYAETRLNPSIIHFCGPEKPWHTQSKHPYTKQYFDYLQLTKWAGSSVV